MPHREDTPVMSVARSGSPALGKYSQEASAAQALEIARESLDGASGSSVAKILENALSQIWGKIQDQPSSYIMTRHEFSIFNFFQHRFIGVNDAVEARKRYWDNYCA